jgi:SAM-dependent methyltransferase
MTDEWSEAAGWWFTEVADDSLFGTDVLPLLERAMPPLDGPWLDLGCGEGRVMRALEGEVLGCDLSFELVAAAHRFGPVVQCRLPDLDWLRTASVGGAYAVLVFEHLVDLAAVLAAVRRIVRPGGHLVVVANHPAFTAEGSGPIVDAEDEEVSWRWGPYLEVGETPTDVGGRIVTFHHRPIGVWLTEAARAGWSLELMIEQSLSDAAVAAYPGYAGQDQLPRLVAWRWKRSRRT